MIAVKIFFFFLILFDSFLWEVSTEQNKFDKPRLLTMTPGCNLRLHEIHSERQPTSVSECATDRLLQLVSKELSEC